ncbi:hypothetical protein PHLGIDRAFT_515447 [Phlebiopsis gigantea 11061_1 CR5-6]|uniref:Uncharacterized protein n=1 Tax=Phlebiopsis gigantea (strain 11061_1 CR5-6) TaxID=745531 RepID=A0A0C3PJQ3_PHLG1|nr:hypothetical protein PHLGIDRAFT_515447 [Phlebiopsis gigantea 11061_1 CR5-6]
MTLISATDYSNTAYNSVQGTTHCIYPLNNVSQACKNPATWQDPSVMYHLEPTHQEDGFHLEDLIPLGDDEFDELFNKEALQQSIAHNCGLPIALPIAHPVPCPGSMVASRSPLHYPPSNATTPSPGPYDQISHSRHNRRFSPYSLPPTASLPQDRSHRFLISPSPPSIPLDFSTYSVKPQSLTKTSAVPSHTSRRMKTKQNYLFQDLSHGFPPSSSPMLTPRNPSHYPTRSDGLVIAPTVPSQKAPRPKTRRTRRTKDTVPQPDAPIKPKKGPNCYLRYKARVEKFLQDRSTYGMSAGTSTLVASRLWHMLSEEAREPWRAEYDRGQPHVKFALPAGACAFDEVPLLDVIEALRHEVRAAVDPQAFEPHLNAVRRQRARYRAEDVGRAWHMELVRERLWIVHKERAGVEGNVSPVFTIDDLLRTEKDLTEWLL